MKLYKIILEDFGPYRNDTNSSKYKNMLMGGVNCYGVYFSNLNLKSYFGRGWLHIIRVKAYCLSFNMQFLISFICIIGISMG